MLRLLRQLTAFLARRPRPQVPPLRLWVDITSRCNLRCPACPQRLLPPAQRRDMDDSLLGSLVEQLARVPGLAPQVSLFHRGEPLLHPRFDHWLARFKAAGCRVRVHTNATLLDRQRVEALLRAGPDLLTCSVDSLEPETYAAARPGAELGRVLAGLERLLRRRRQLGLASPRVGLLLMSRERPGREVKELQRLRGLGLDRVLWRRPHNWAGAVGPPPPGGARLNPCTFPWYALAVLSSGVVTPCPQDFFGHIPLGRAPGEPLMAIWRAEPAQRLRRAQAVRRLDHYQPCRNCDRPRRAALWGLPLEHLKNFLGESIFRSPKRLP